MTTAAQQLLDARRPARADARRNFDALVTAALAAFAEDGVDASLEDIARRAGVGIGTLYRNFPTRDALIEVAYLGEVAEVAALAERLREEEPVEAFDAWMQRLTDYLRTKKVLIEGLNRESDVLKSCRVVLFESGEPLLERAQTAGAIRDDIEISDVIRLLSGVSGVVTDDPAQRDRIIGIAIDGLRPANAPVAAG